jgi:hypothetical protein
MMVAAGQTTGSNTEEDAEAEEGAAAGASSETTDRSVAVAAEADVAAEEDVAEEEAVDTTTRELETVTNMGITSDITEAIVATRSTAHSLLRVKLQFGRQHTRWLKDLWRLSHTQDHISAPCVSFEQHYTP